MRKTLKPFLVLCLFSFLIIHEVKSQFNEFGFDAGLLLTDWVGDSNADSIVSYGSRTGFFIGVYSRRSFNNPNLELDYGLRFSLKGFNVNGRLIVPGVTFGANLQNYSVYADVPVAVRYRFGVQERAGFFVKGGIQFSYLVHNTIEGEVSYNGNNRYYGDPDSNADELQRFDLSIFPALGYQFDNGLQFQILYEYGLINTVKDDEYLGYTKANNSVLRFLIGIDL